MLGSHAVMEGPGGPPKETTIQAFVPLATTAIGAEPLMEPGPPKQTPFSESGLNFVDALAELPQSKMKVAKELLEAKDDGHIGGLLSSPEGRFGSVKSVLAVVAELLGTLIFAFAASTTPSGTSQQQGAGNQPVNWSPWGNGITLIIVVYLCANVSGGHLNPAVTFATIITGHINILLGCAYIIAQLTGAIFGLLLTVNSGLGTWVGMGDSGPGCFHSGMGITYGQIFAWELIMTWVLVSVVFAVAIGKPSFGNVAPLAVGLTLFALNFSGGSFTGTAINPARALAPAFVFHCYLDQIWVYVIAEFTGGAVAGLMAGPLYGVRAKWLKRRMPKLLNMGMREGREASPKAAKKPRAARIAELERRLTESLDDFDLERGRRPSTMSSRPIRPSIDVIPEGKPHVPQGKAL